VFFSDSRGGGGDLLRYNLQGVDHGDVAQTLSNRQGGVAIRGGGVGLGPVLQQDVDDVRVALLGGLVQRRVAVL